jgi:MoxR-like ATPase
MKQKQDRESVNADLRAKFGATITRADILKYRKQTGINPTWIRRDDSLRVGRGLYRIPGANYVPSTETARKSRKSHASVSDRLVPAAVPQSAPAPAPVTMSPVTHTESIDQASMSDSAVLQSRLSDIATQASLLAQVPAKDSAFVPFGDYDMIEQVVSSRKFFPIFITGPSGNGKTFGVEQACARTGREYIYCAITTETDEDDLLGGFRLRNGNTVFEVGPVVVAMLRGAVLLLDEVDKASAKIMCLQPIVDGKPIVLKKLGITVHAAPGFTVMATANTKGRGDESGKFITSVLLDESFLERFPITVEQEYPSVNVEKKILAKTFVKMGFQMTPHAEAFIDTLCRWAEAIRVTFTEGGIEDLVSTRRLCHVIRAYAIFNGDDGKALAYCVNRFDPKVKEAFRDLYNKLAPDAAAPSNVGSLDGTATVSTPSF